MHAVEEACARAEPPRRFHMERFGPAPSVPSGLDVPVNDVPFTVTLNRAGVELEVPSDRSVLDVVRDTVPGVPFSCEEGYCGSCETRVLLGVPDHRDDVLSESEKAANDTMFICVSRSKSPNLMLDL
jgi:ferredoxin